MKKYIVLSILTAVVLCHQNCSDVSFSTTRGAEDLIDGGLGDNPPGDDNTVPLSNATIDYNQPSASITKKVDMLFVVDTSSSLNDQRGNIATNIDLFVNQLPADGDYRIAVLLGHGSTSSWNGKLYKKGLEPIVLDSKNLTVQQIRDALKQKLTSPAEDGASDGGEMGLFATWSLLQPTPFAKAQEAGFFRSDAALAVTYVADEQDICYDYPEGFPVVKDGDNIEPKAKDRDCVPNKITPALVYNQLRALGGEAVPLLIAGIIHLDPSKIPVPGGEKEVGYGYTDIIALNRGLGVDITSDIAKGLEKIGTLVTSQLNLKTSFLLKANGLSDCPSQVVKDSIEVRVDNQLKPYRFVPSTCEVQLMIEDAGKANSAINIRFSYKPLNQ